MKLSEKIQGVLSQGAVPDEGWNAMATPEEQLQQLVAQVAALTAAQGDQHAALQQMRAERDQWKGLLDEAASRQQEMQQALMQTQQALIEQQRATTAAVSAGGSSASRTVKHLDVLKAVRQPQSLKDRDGWEKFGFQVEIYSEYQWILWSSQT